MIDPAQYQYIKDVLGVTQVMVPEGFQRSNQSLTKAPMATGSATAGAGTTGSEPVPEPKAHVHYQSDAPVAILTNHGLNQAQQLLALKILSAVGIQNPSIVEINGMSPEMMDIVEQSVPARWFVYFEEHFEKFYGTIEKSKQSQVLYTFSLDYMLEGESTQIQTYKRQVWNHMKLFSKRWEKP